MKESTDIGKLFAELTVGFEDAAGMAVLGQRADLELAEARMLNEELARYLTRLVQLQAELENKLGR